ncbi:MAG: PP2C family serine/threonine-protein phosphatase [Eubacteriales bacterium]|nr:PP2C family serine/threonine-protein phosphatase [Eubacteriales bacterium]
MAVIYAIAESIKANNSKLNSDAFQFGTLTYPDRADQACRAARSLDDYWQFYSLSDAVGKAGAKLELASIAQDLWTEICSELIANPPIQLDYELFLRTYYQRLDSAMASYFGSSETTLTGVSIATALVKGRQLYLSTVGSTRVFMLRDGEFFRLSEAPLRPFTDPRGAKLSYPGISLQSGIQAEESFYIELEEGDEIYLLSDGLARTLSPRVLEAELSAQAPLHYRFERLLQLLKAGVLTDHATLLLIRCERIFEFDQAPEEYGDDSWLDIEDDFFSAPINSASALNNQEADLEWSDLEDYDVDQEEYFEATEPRQIERDKHLTFKLVIWSLLVIFILGLALLLFIIWRHFIAN